MGHTNRSVQKFTRWAQAAATTWPEMGMGSAGPGHRWNWAGLADSSYSNNTGSFLHSSSTEVQKTHSLQMYRHHFRSKMCWNVSATSWKGFGGDPWAKPRWRAEESSSSTQHLRISRECLILWLQPKDNTPALSLRLQSTAQAGTESHFTFLDNLETNTQTQTYFGHSQTRSRPKEEGKKKSILLTPNWFYDSMVRHYSTSLNDTHDLILQKFPLFLGQSPNIIF